MTLYNTDNMRILFTKEEYLKVCADANKSLSKMQQYDLVEIECSDFDEIVIDETILDETEHGFYMWSSTFYGLFSKYTNWPLIHDELIITEV